MEIYVALLCLLIGLWLAWRWKRISTFKELGIPGPKPNIIFGNILELYRKGPLHCHEEWVKNYGRVVGYYYGMKPVLLVADPLLIKNIFIKDFAKFMNREGFNPLFKYDPHNEFAQSILNLPGQAWKDMRSVLTPTFTTAKMKQMSGSINSSIEEMVNILDERASEGKSFDIYNIFQRLTMDVITRTAFGVKTDVQKNPKSKILRTTKAVFRAPYRSIWVLIGLCFPWLRRISFRLQGLIAALTHGGSLPFKTLRKGIQNVIDLRKENPQAKKSDLLQLMMDASIVMDKEEIEVSHLEAGNIENEKEVTNEESDSKRTRRLTNGEITSSATAVLLAGYETTATTLGFTVYLLSKHKDIQERLFEEIQQLIESGQKLEYATVNKLPYLDQVLHESLRIYPPVVFFTTRYALEDVEYDNVKIPKGMLVLAPVHLLHHDSEFWPDPEIFDPERFSTKPNADGITYMPFSVGPRNCLGMRFAQLEVKLALTNIIYKFRLHLASEQKGNFPTTVSLRILSPSRGVHVRIERRDSKVKS